MRIYISIIAIFVALVAVILMINLEDDLEKIKIGDIGVSKGQSLRITTNKMNSSLISLGEPWRVIISTDVADKKAPSNFGGGGNGYLIARIARQFGCKFILIKEDNLIIIY